MSFIIYPAIDLKDGNCVRLLQGKMEDVTIYGNDPAFMAKKFQDAGAKWIHVVDLNGAFTGKSVNDDAIRAIVNNIDIPIQVGGGIRNIHNISYMLDDIGVTRVILGTAALQNPKLVQHAVEKYGDRIAVGVDAQDGYVAVNGWAEKSKIKAIDLVMKMAFMGVQTIIYTDISRDGMMGGPNLGATKEISQKSGISIILSGGVATIDDIIAAKKANLAGAISGKAIYTGAINLREALRLC